MVYLVLIYVLIYILGEFVSRRIGLPHSVDDTVAGIGSQEGADRPAHTDGGQVGERRGAVLCGHTRHTSRRLAETASSPRSADNKKA